MSEIKKTSVESAVDSTKELSAFEKAEKIRYEKLAKSPVQSGPRYLEPNLDADTFEEILGL